MIRISRYFENQFDDREISDDELRAFAVDHLARLIAQNSAALFDAAIAATATALTDFHGAVADESTAGAIRKSRTSATNVLMDEIKGKRSRREGKISDAFGDDSAEYVAFYPQGVSEYRNATMEDMTKLLTRYAKLADDNVPALGQPFADEWNAYKTKWAAVRGAQVTQKGTATGAADQSGAARTELELQLQANVLTVALQNIGQPARAALFFQQSLLENHAAPAATPAPAPATPVPPAHTPAAKPQP